MYPLIYTPYISSLIRRQTKSFHSNDKSYNVLKTSPYLTSFSYYLGESYDYETICRPSSSHPRGYLTSPSCRMFEYIHREPARFVGFGGNFPLTLFLHSLLISSFLTSSLHIHHLNDNSVLSHSLHNSSLFHHPLHDNSLLIHHCTLHLFITTLLHPTIHTYHNYVSCKHTCHSVDIILI